MSLPDILNAVKNYLDITWDDNAVDEKLCGIISRGTSYLNSIAGAELDYNIEGEPRRLLLNYCLYDWSRAADEFPKNYQSDLLRLQIMQEVKEHVETESDV